MSYIHNKLYDTELNQADKNEERKKKARDLN